ncbi:MAG: hypothetical protein JWN00_5655 [Actinomycetia bacterium]|nr:hypothetical protein [Actinomycetes bacterium]
MTLFIRGSLLVTDDGLPDMPPELDEHDYLRRLELLARDVVGRALDEGWVSYPPDPQDATPLQRAVNELARTLRHYHFEGDGCVETQPLYRIGGAGLLRPETDSFTEICGQLGVEARAEGWAGLFNMARQLGAAIGLAALVTLASTLTRHQLSGHTAGIAQLQGYRGALLAGKAG